jgi:hypothetical protein
LDQKVPEAIIQKVDEEMVEKYCEGTHARGNGKNRYPRAGGIERHPVLSVGRLSSGYTELKTRKGIGFSSLWKISL